MTTQEPAWESEVPEHARPRRTQVERSQATRERVCEATLEGLYEVGYEKISTTFIAQKAKVSRGALTHQFPTRNALMVAAYQHLVDSWAEVYPLGESFSVKRMRIADLIDSLWENLFSTQRYIAALELMLAARQDNELGRDLRKVMVGWIEKRDTKAVELLGGSLDNEQDALFVQLTLAVLRGIAVHQSFDNDYGTPGKLLAMWKEIARQIEADPARAGLIKETLPSA